MTSVVAGGIFNAFAFAGAGYLFQKFNKMDTVRRQKDIISLWNNSRKHDKNGIKKT